MDLLCVLAVNHQALGNVRTQTSPLMATNHGVCHEVQSQKAIPGLGKTSHVWPRLPSAMSRSCWSDFLKLLHSLAIIIHPHLSSIIPHYYSLCVASLIGVSYLTYSSGMHIQSHSTPLICTDLTNNRGISILASLQPHRTILCHDARASGATRSRKCQHEVRQTESSWASSIPPPIRQKHTEGQYDILSVQPLSHLELAMNC